MNFNFWSHPKKIKQMFINPHGFQPILVWSGGTRMMCLQQQVGIGSRQLCRKLFGFPVFSNFIVLIHNLHDAFSYTKVQFFMARNLLLLSKCHFFHWPWLGTPLLRYQRANWTSTSPWTKLCACTFIWGMFYIIYTISVLHLPFFICHVITHTCILNIFQLHHCIYCLSSVHYFLYMLRNAVY